MSYNNLALYDYSLLTNIKNIDLHYFYNAKYNSNPLNIKCNKIYNYSDKTGFLKIISYLKSQILLLMAIQSKSPSIAHFQWLKIPQIDFLIMKLLKLKGIKIVLTAHNILPHGTENKYEGIYKKIYALVDAIIVHSNNTQIELIEKFNILPNKTHVIPHGTLDIGQNIDLNRVDYFVEKFKKDYNLDKKIVFSAMGMINKYKGYDLIVDAWKMDNVTNNEKLMLVVAGKGNYRGLERIKGDKNTIFINRFLLDEEFLAILKITDFVLLPYTKISQSGILLTAINERKRVIVSNIGGLTDPFKFGEIGYILPELNYNELNKAIIQMALKVNDYPQERTWNRIFEYFNWKNIGLETQQLYLKISSIE